MSVILRRVLRPALLLLALASLSSCHSTIPDRPSAGVSPKRDGAYAVRVIWKEASLSGARIEWRLRPEGEAVLSRKALSKGIEAFDPAPGTYFVVADWRSDGDFARPLKPGDRFGYFGMNPVVVVPNAEGDVTLPLEEVPATLPVSSGGTGVSGRVTLKGEPVSGVVVSAFPRFEVGFRDRGFLASAQSDASGDFRFDLPPGNYYLLARQRSGGGVVGPMQKGDLFGYAPMNPVMVEVGGYSSASIPMVRLNNIDAAAVRAKASVAGIIVDVSGKPVEGAYAALYETPELLGRPAYHSEPTGKDGVFHLPVPVPGTYFLGARTGYGGAPSPGDWYGRYEETPDHAVAIRPDERLQNLKIVVEKVP